MIRNNCGISAVRSGPGPHLRVGVRHDAVVDAVEAELRSQGLGAWRRRYRMSSTGVRLYYCVDLEGASLAPGLDPALCCTLGFLNTLESRVLTKAYGGVSSRHNQRGVVLFRFTLERRRTHKMDLGPLVEEAVDCFRLAAAEFPLQLQALMGHPLSKARAAALLAKAAGETHVQGVRRAKWHEAGKMWRDYCKRRGRDIHWLLWDFCERIAERPLERCSAYDLDCMYDFYCELDKETRRDVQWVDDDDTYGDQPMKYWIPRHKEDG
jgi:hypothetical protein